MKKFTLVSTVFNEASRLKETISDIENQTLKPDEIIVTDAGSNDGTLKELNEWASTSEIKIIVLEQKGCNVAQGRNLAIKKASNDLIVSTDFGCRFHPDWLYSIIEPFDGSNVQVVGGAFSVKEEEINKIAAKANFLLTNGYHNVLNDDFIPSSRSIAYYKKVWEEAHGYPEWLTLAADDLVFGKKIKSLGYDIFLVEKPYVFWGRHGKLRGYAKEAFRYGLGDGEARVNKRNTISNFIEILMRYGFLFFLSFLLVFTFLHLITLKYFLFLGVFIFGFRSYFHAFKKWNSWKSPKYNFRVFLYSLLLIEITRVNYLWGYFKGYFLSPIEIKKEAKSLKDLFG